MKRWPARLWRWQITIRPVPVLVLYVCLHAATWWLPYGAIHTVRVVLWWAIAVCVAIVVALFASAWRRRARAKRERMSA